MELVKYFERAEPNALFRVVVDGHLAEGYVATPSHLQWSPSGGVIFELEQPGHDLVEISHDEATAALRTWDASREGLDEPPVRVIALDEPFELWADPSPVPDPGPAPVRAGVRSDDVVVDRFVALAQLRDLVADLDAADVA